MKFKKLDIGYVFLYGYLAVFLALIGLLKYLKYTYD